MEDSKDTDSITTLIERGKSLLQRIQGIQDADFFSSIIGYLGRMIVPHVENPSWRNTASGFVDASIDALSSKGRKLHEDYTEWYADCMILFSKQGWNKSRLVKVFEKIPSLATVEPIGTKVRMIVERQIEILENLLEKPPKAWSLARATVLVVYVSICVFVDTILSILFGLAVVPVAAFEVGLVLAFPKLEAWIVG